VACDVQLALGPRQAAPPPEQASGLPESVTMEGASWADVRESQELYAREFERWVSQVDPALIRWTAVYTDETNDAVWKAVNAADFRSLTSEEAVKRTNEQLLRDYPDPCIQGQVLFREASELGMAGKTELVADVIEQAMTLPLWPYQRGILHQIKGRHIVDEYRRRRGPDIPQAEDPLFCVMRRKVAVEYLKGIKEACAAPFPAGLPNLKQPNMLERVQLPDDPVQKQRVLDAIRHRKIVQAKAGLFMNLLHCTETLKFKLADSLASHYAEEPRNTAELSDLATEILQDPSEVARLMEQLRHELAKPVDP
jgi:hypothetical protein